MKHLASYKGRVIPVHAESQLEAHQNAVTMFGAPMSDWSAIHVVRASEAASATIDKHPSWAAHARSLSRLVMDGTDREMVSEELIKMGLLIDQLQAQIKYGS